MMICQLFEIISLFLSYLLLLFLCLYHSIFLPYSLFTILTSFPPFPHSLNPTFSETKYYTICLLDLFECSFLQHDVLPLKKCLNMSLLLVAVSVVWMLPSIFFWPVLSTIVPVQRTYRVIFLHLGLSNPSLLMEYHNFCLTI